MGPPLAEALALLTIATMADHRVFEDFFDCWMQQGARSRKDLSYSGALRSQKGDPVHYTCPHTGQRYFDPTNMIYATAMCFLAPSLMVQRNWSDETRGDIFEGLLGYYYEMKHTKQTEIDLHGLADARDVSMIIEGTSWLTHKLYNTNEMDFYYWCTRIIDRAAHLRKDKHHLVVATSILPKPRAGGLEAPSEKPRLLARIPWQ